MEIRTHTLRIELSAGRVLTLERQPPVRITCEAGQLWITDGNSSDIVLGTGEGYTARGTRLVVMEALLDSVLTIGNSAIAQSRRQTAAGSAHGAISRLCAASLRA